MSLLDKGRDVRARRHLAVGLNKAQEAFEARVIDDGQWPAANALMVSQSTINLVIDFAFVVDHPWVLPLLTTHDVIGFVFSTFGGPSSSTHRNAKSADPFEGWECLKRTYIPSRTSCI